MALAGMTGPPAGRWEEGVCEEVGVSVLLGELVSEMVCRRAAGELVCAGGGCTVTIARSCRGCARAGPVSD